MLLSRCITLQSFLGTSSLRIPNPILLKSYSGFLSDSVLFNELTIISLTDQES